MIDFGDSVYKFDWFLLNLNGKNNTKKCRKIERITQKILNNNF